MVVAILRAHTQLARFTGPSTYTRALIGFFVAHSACGTVTIVQTLFLITFWPREARRTLVAFSPGKVLETLTLGHGCFSVRLPLLVYTLTVTAAIIGAIFRVTIGAEIAFFAMAHTSAITQAVSRAI